MHITGTVTVQSVGTFLHHFKRSRAVPQKDVHSNGLASGDRIVVSDQEGRFVGLATGYLCEVNKMSLSCTLDRWKLMSYLKYFNQMVLKSSD